MYKEVFQDTAENTEMAGHYPAVSRSYSADSSVYRQDDIQ